MGFVCGNYRWLAGLALLSLPACLYYPRPMDASDYSTNPYSSALAPPVPMPPRTATAVVAKPQTEAPPIRQIKYETKQPGWTPPAVSPAVVLQTVEPIDAPLPKVDATAAPPLAAERARIIERKPVDMSSGLAPLAMRLTDGSLMRADPQDVAAAVEQINVLLMPLRARAALEIPKLCFCRPVSTPARFGTFERLEENHLFKAGETVAVYMELRNFSCTPQQGDFATHVVSSVEIHDADGKVVFRFDSDRADASLSPRQDYCHVGRFTLPALPAGAYTLWLKATDVPTGRVARRSLDFRLASNKS
jgi:hypothetical protein